MLKQITVEIIVPNYLSSAKCLPLHGIQSKIYVLWWFGLDKNYNNF